MARYKYDWSYEKFKRFIKEGRGKGTLGSYRPWLTVYDISSRGRSSRLLGWKSGRVHHLLTEAELLYFYLLEWDSTCIDIREQYPLLGLYDMKHILNERLLKRLFNGRANAPYVLTTTFLITVKDQVLNKEKLVARSIKDPSTYHKPLVQDLMECQARYWEANGVDWGVVDPTKIPRKRAKNIEWLHPYYNLEKWGFGKQEIEKLTSLFLHNFNVHDPVREVCLQFDNRYGLATGTGLTVYKYLLAHKQITINIDSNITDTYLSIKDMNEYGGR